MSSTLVITLKMNRAQGDLTRYKLDTTQPRNESTALKDLFRNLASGTETASFDVQTSANAPVRASQTLTLTYASISTEDTFVVGGITFEAVTGTPGSSDEFKKQTDATVTAANLVTVVNAHATAKLLVKASSAAAVVTFTALTPGVIGNQIPLVGSTGMVAGAATFASGAGGCETVAVNYSRGL